MDKITNKFYIVVGASASGKGVLMKEMCRQHLWIQWPKYSTREHRGKDDDIINIDDNSQELSSLTQKQKKLKKQLENNPASEDAIKIELITIENKVKDLKLAIMKDYCGNNKGELYFLNSNFYGFNTSNILKSLENNNLVVVCSDWDIIKKFKSDKVLSQYTRVIYLATSIDEKELLKRYKSREKEIKFDGTSEEIINNIQNMYSILTSAGRLRYLEKIEETMPLLNEQWNSILPYFDTIKARATNIRLLYNRYIDNIQYVDQPVLNFYDLDFMYDQQRNFINNDADKSKITGAPVFMVCAAPSSGKATLMTIVDGLGSINEQIVITKKYAKRQSRPTDLRDGMTAIGINGKFEDYIKDPNNIWPWQFHNKKTEYAVDISEIQENIKQNKPQIFISNIGQIEKARELFPNNIVVLYLHATHETATKKHIILKRKTEIAIDLSKKNNISFDDAMEEVTKNKVYQDQVERDVINDLQEIKSIHESYRDNCYKIDHVLLNTGTNNDLIQQMINLINYYMK